MWLIQICCKSINIGKVNSSLRIILLLSLVLGVLVYKKKKSKVGDLLFDLGIERIAITNNKTKKHKKQLRQAKQLEEPSTLETIHQPQKEIMGENIGPRWRLGDYAHNFGPRHFSSIVKPTKSIEMKPWLF